MKTFLTLLALLATASLPQTDLYSKALGLGITEVEEIEPPGPDALAAVTRATGTEAPDAELYSVRYARGGMEPLPAKLAVVPADQVGKGYRAIVLLDDERRFLGASIVDGDGKRVGEWAHFLSLLRFRPVPRLDGARPPAHLDEMRAKAEKGELGEDSALVLALLDLLRCMNEQASVFNIPQEASSLDPVEQARMMNAQYTRIAELGDALAPLLGDAKAEFVQLAENSAAETAVMADAIAAGEVTGSKARRRAVMGNCKACHDLDVPSFDGGLAAASRELRAQLEIGDGYYRVGHDLRIGHPDRKRSQNVADAVRRAILMLEAATRSE